VTNVLVILGSIRTPNQKAEILKQDEKPHSDF